MDATDADGPISRRGFLASAGAAAAVGASGTAAAQEGNASSGSSGGGSTKTVQVGAQGNGGYFAFAPEEVTVAPGTTVVWKWTGKGGAHNVVSDDDAFDSGSPVADAGTTFKHTFSETGEFPYHCVPHKSLGMVGTITVQEGGASAAGGGGGGLTLPDSAKNLGIAAMSVMLSTVGLAYFFMRFGGDFEAAEE